MDALTGDLIFKSHGRVLILPETPYRNCRRFNMTNFNIAIDDQQEPKAPLQKIAKELGFIYVDTGAMYRAMALFFTT